MMTLIWIPVDDLSVVQKALGKRSWMPVLLAYILHSNSGIKMSLWMDGDYEHEGAFKTRGGGDLPEDIQVTHYALVSTPTVMEMTTVANRTKHP